MFLLGALVVVALTMDPPLSHESWIRIAQKTNASTFLRSSAESPLPSTLVIYPPLVSLLVLALQSLVLPWDFATTWVLTLAFALLATSWYTAWHLLWRDSEAPRPYGRGISPNASRSLMRNPSEAGAKESIDTAHSSLPSRAGPPAKGGEVLLVAVLLCAFLLGRGITFGRYDLLLTLLLFLTWKSFERGREAESAFFLTIASGLKIVPVLAFPLLALQTPPSKRCSLFIGALLGLLIALGIPLLFLGPPLFLESLQHFATFHGQRGVQMESLWSGLELLLRQLQGGTSQVALSALAWDNAELGRRTETMAAILILLGVLWMTLRTWTAPREQFPLSLFLLLLWSIAWSPVFSPQYLLWIFPLLLVWLYERAREGVDWRIFTILSLTLLIGFCTQWIYPLFYRAFLEQSSLIHTVILNLRNLSLLALFALLWKTRETYDERKSSTTKIVESAM
jgi:hypothetical protein